MQISILQMEEKKCMLFLFSPEPTPLPSFQPKFKNLLGKQIIKTFWLLWTYGNNTEQIYFKKVIGEENISFGVLLVPTVLVLFEALPTPKKI